MTGREGFLKNINENEDPSKKLMIMKWRNFDKLGNRFLSNKPQKNKYKPEDLQNKNDVVSSYANQ